MSLTDLVAVVERAQADERFRTFVKVSPEELCSRYALSSDELAALQQSDEEALDRFGLDGRHVAMARLLN